MRVAYYPGCTVKSTAKCFEDSSIAAMSALGVELVELPRWNCCGTVHALAKDDVIHYMAPTRILSRVEEMNEHGVLHDEFRLTTVCAMCYNTLKRANAVVKPDHERLEKLHSTMERDPPYKGKTQVVHLLELIRDNSAVKTTNRVMNPLKSLRVASYYGCLLLRPRDIALDKPENPRIMDELITDLGAENVYMPYSTRCCGAYHTVTRKDIVVESAHRILTQARGMGAELVSVVCPLCSYNLCERQEDVMKDHPQFKKIPVVYFTQLMALAFGLGENGCRFSENYIDPRPLLSEKGLI